MESTGAARVRARAAPEDRLPGHDEVPALSRVLVSVRYDPFTSSSARLRGPSTPSHGGANLRGTTEGTVMTHVNDYLPILKGKEGELRSLGDLSADVKNK